MAGIAAGLLIGGGALYAAFGLAMAGHDWVAGVIGGTTVVALVSAFVVGATFKGSKGNAGQRRDQASTR